eukprot:scaffold1805_cov166-Chaetoceros_neogracile.AAC.3
MGESHSGVPTAATLDRIAESKANNFVSGEPTEADRTPCRDWELTEFEVLSHQQYKHSLSTPGNWSEEAQGVQGIGEACYIVWSSSRCRAMERIYMLDGIGYQVHNEATKGIIEGKPHTQYCVFVGTKVGVGSRVFFSAVRIIVFCQSIPSSNSSDSIVCYTL